MTTLRKVTKGGRSGGPRKEAYFVRVETPDGKAEFYNATDQLGQPMPFSKPQATVAMRASADTVGFSFLQLTKKTASSIVGAPMELPRGPLSKLERKASQLELGVDDVIVEIAPQRPRRERPSTPEVVAGEATDGADTVANDTVANDMVANDTVADDTVANDTVANDTVAPPAGSLAALILDDPEPEPVKATVVASAVEAAAPERYRLKLTRDDNGVAHLELVDEGKGSSDGDDEATVELPYGALRLSLYLRSPKVDRKLAVGFIGYPGKPGNPETVVRLASMILFSLTQLVEFRILSGIETVDVPSPPSRWNTRSVAKPEDQVVFSVPVWLFSEAGGEPLARGEVMVEIDLRNANPSSARLLYHFHPSAEIVETFAAYRQVFELSITEALRLALGDDEISNITYDIVLGGVDAGTVERLRDAAATIPAYDLTPAQKRAHA